METFITDGRTVAVFAVIMAIIFAVWSVWDYYHTWRR